MKNQSLLILALLSANNRLDGPPIHRTTLVKQAFLAETIRPLYGLWLRTFEFVRYYYGPYSDEIFQRLDTLIFNGLAEVVAIGRQGGKVEARYQITAAGHRLLIQSNQSEIIALATDLVWALQTLGIEKASTLCKLVYQESEFARIFARHDEQGVGAETKAPLPIITAANNETFVALATLQELQGPLTTEKPLPSREVVRLFLNALACQIPSPDRSESITA